ncbi:hypothetical protein HN448_04600 [archaeon]|nr:hypothetical protein [archaeon]
MQPKLEIIRSSSLILDNFNSQSKIKLKKELIKQFSEEGNIIFDPFLNLGETLFACHETKRNGISMTEDSNSYFEVNEKIKKLESQLQLSNYGCKQNSKHLLLKNKLKDFDYIWQQYKLPKIELIVTFLPNWKSLQKLSKEMNRTDYEYDLNPTKLIVKILTELKNKIKHGAYIILLVENNYLEDKYNNFSGRLSLELEKEFLFKGEKMVCIKNKINESKFSINHKNLLFFRKFEI